MSINSTLRKLASLGDRLVEERKRLKWSRGDMATRGEVSVASQRLYDANNLVPSLNYLLLITRAGADFNYILNGERKASSSLGELNITEDSVESAVLLAVQMLRSENNSVTDGKDAAELVISILRQVHDAKAPGMDKESIEAATASNR